MWLAPGREHVLWDGWMDGWNYPKWLFIPIEELGRFKVFFGLLDCLVILGFYI